MKTRKNEDAMGHGAKRERKEWRYRRGDIYLANLNPFKGSEQGGKRPVLVIQNNTGNRFSGTVIIAAISVQPGKVRGQPTHYTLPPVGVLKTACIVQLEQIRTIDKSRIMKYYGRVPMERMREINRAIKLSLGISRAPGKGEWKEDQNVRGGCGNPKGDRLGRGRGKEGDEGVHGVGHTGDPGHQQVVSVQPGEKRGVPLCPRREQHPHIQEKL